MILYIGMSAFLGFHWKVLILQIPFFPRLAYKMFWIDSIVDAASKKKAQNKYPFSMF